MSGNHINYKKIYFILLGLLVLSVAGPFIGIFWVTMVTAFGIALIKANLVIQNFMHLRAEKRLVKWILITSLVLMALFVGGVAPDILRHEGQNWVNTSAQAAVARGVGGGDHGEGISGEAHDGGESASGEHIAESIIATPVAVAGFDAQGAYDGVCAACHGSAGEGSGPAAGSMNPAPANFTDPGFWADRDNQHIFDVIKNGAASVGGSPLMMGWSGTFTDDQIAGLADYISTQFRP